LGRITVEDKVALRLVPSNMLGCFGTAPAEALFGRFGVRADVSRDPTFMIVIRNARHSFVPHDNLAGPRANG